MRSATRTYWTKVLEAEPTHHGQATRTAVRKSSCRRGTSPRHLKAIGTQEESTDEDSRSANCDLSPNPHLHRASPTDSRRLANPTSRMGRAKWRILDAPHGTARHFDANGIRNVPANSLLPMKSSPMQPQFSPKKHHN